MSGEDIMKIMVGDVVTLKSGGPRMTVVSIDDERCACIWFSGEELRKETFPRNALISELQARMGRGISDGGSLTPDRAQLGDKIALAPWYTDEGVGIKPGPASVTDRSYQLTTDGRLVRGS